MRRVVVVAAVLVLAALVSPTGAGAATGPRPASTMYVPSPFPHGWFVNGAVSPVDTVGDGGFTFYARRSDPAHGPALAVGSISGEDGFDGLRDDHPERVDGLVDGMLARRGRYTWVTWAGDGQDVVNLVSGRDLSDAEVVAAARAGRGSSIAPKGIPDGLERLLSADIFPDGAAPAERITLVDASGTKRVELEAFNGSPLVRAMQQFWVEQSSRREHAGGRHTAALAPRHRPIVVARGDASVGELEDMAASMQATDDAGWQAFRDRVLDLPLTALFPLAANADGVVIDGATAGTRWAVAFSRGTGLAAAWTQIVTADLSSGGGGTGVPEGALPEVLSAGSVTTNGGSIFAGVIPAAAASARFEPVGLPAVDAVLGPTTPDGAHRYFAAWLAGVAGTVPLVVYDAAGNVIVQRSQFGCNTCDA